MSLLPLLSSQLLAVEAAGRSTGRWWWSRVPQSHPRVPQCHQGRQGRGHRARCDPGQRRGMVKGVALQPCKAAGGDATCWVPSQRRARRQLRRRRAAGLPWQSSVYKFTDYLSWVLFWLSESRSCSRAKGWLSVGCGHKQCSGEPSPSPSKAGHGTERKAQTQGQVCKSPAQPPEGGLYQREELASMDTNKKIEFW